MDLRATLNRIPEVKLKKIYRDLITQDLLETRAHYRDLADFEENPTYRPGLAGHAYLFPEYVSNFKYLTELEDTSAMIDVIVSYKEMEDARIKAIEETKVNRVLATTP